MFSAEVITSNRAGVEFVDVNFVGFIVFGD